MGRASSRSVCRRILVRGVHPCARRCPRRDDYLVNTSAPNNLVSRGVGAGVIIGGQALGNSGTHGCAAPPIGAARNSAYHRQVAFPSEPRGLYVETLQSTTPALDYPSCSVGSMTPTCALDTSTTPHQTPAPSARSVAEAACRRDESNWTLAPANRLAARVVEHECFRHLSIGTSALPAVLLVEFRPSASQVGVAPRLFNGHPG